MMQKDPEARTDDALRRLQLRQALLRQLPEVTHSGAELAARGSRRRYKDRAYLIGGQGRDLSARRIPPRARYEGAVRA